MAEENSQKGKNDSILKDTNRNILRRGDYWPTNPLSAQITNFPFANGYTCCNYTANLQLSESVTGTCQLG